MLLDRQTLAFVLIAALLTVTPGADMALVTRVALSRGFRAARRTSLGIVSGLFVWAAASALGIAALVATSAQAFTVLKLVGAAYLVALGLVALWTTRRPRAEDALERGQARFAFLQGFVNNVTNPKIAVFYSTLLPQFLSADDPVLAKSLLLAGIHAVLGIVWLFAYAWFVARGSTALRRPRVRAWIDRATGCVLIGLGVRLAFERR
jgi:threonine/homoserine/homoserine lactone efflux protein